MISGDGGWGGRVINLAQHFAAMGNLVIGVDVTSYLNILRNKKGACYNCSADYVNLATQVEKMYHLRSYQSPILMGYSRGATLVYALLAQARPGTFCGGISLGFCTEIDLPKPFCHLAGIEIKERKNEFLLKPDLDLGNRWIVLQGKLDEVCNYRETLDFVKKTTDAELIVLDGVNHGFSDETKFMPQLDKAYQSLLHTDTDSVPAKTVSISDIQDLPLSITNDKVKNKDLPFLIFLSGDGGWYNFEQRISDRLAMLGIPTVGLDVKKYFWNRRSPKETTDDIVKIIQAYESKWDKHSFILMGYSMGAEVLPFVLNRLPAAQKANLAGMVLLSPAGKGDFEIHLSTMLGLGSSKNDYDVRQEIGLIPEKWQKQVLIIFGDAEKTKLPSQLSSTQVRFASVTGDHHYNGKTDGIFEALKKIRMIP
jgi:type IV secretory pathway VirJ component